MTVNRWRMEKKRTCPHCGKEFVVSTVPSGRRMCRSCQHERQAHGMPRMTPDTIIPPAKIDAFMDAVVANESKPPWERDTVDNLRRRLLS